MIDADIAAQVMGMNNGAPGNPNSPVTPPVDSGTATQSPVSPTTPIGVIDPDIAGTIMGKQIGQQIPNMIKDPQTGSSTPLMSGISGFDQTLEKIPANIAIVGAKLLDNAGATQNAEKGVQNFYAKRSADYQQSINQNPGAGAVGQGVGAIAASAPLIPITGAAGLAAGGAALGYGLSNPSDEQGDKLVAAGASGLLGGALGAVIPAGTTLLKGLAASFKSPADVINAATNQTLGSIAPGAASITPTGFMQNLATLTKAAQDNKNSLYAARDTLADQEGVYVNKSNLNNVVNTLQSNIPKGTTPNSNAALSAAKDALGDGTPIPYQHAQALVSNVGSQINDATTAGNYGLANALTPIKQSLLADIQQGGGSAALQTAKQTADNYYKNVYNPLRSIGADDILTDHLADSGAIAGLMKSHVMDNPQALQAMGQPAQNQLIAAHINALKSAATDPTSGIIDVSKYSAALTNSLKSNPTQFAGVADKVGALSGALQYAKAQTSLTADVSQHSLGQGLGGAAAAGMVGLMHSPEAGVGAAGTTLAAQYLLPKAKFAYAMGKVLSNPDIAPLLNASSKASSVGNKGLVNNLATPIAKAFSRSLVTLPPEIDN